MSPTEALLQAVIADPDNDSPRLQLADHWARTGEDPTRADLIRTQIALELLREQDRSWPETIRRERELLESHQSSWERPLRNAIRPSIRSPGSWLRSHLFGTGGTWGFRRGFVEQVLNSAAGFLQDEIQLFDLTPIREVLLTNASRHIEDLIQLPRLDGLRGLHLVSDADFDEDMQFLIDSAQQQGLTVREVQVPRIDGDLIGLLSLLSSSDRLDDPRLDEFRIWRAASTEQRERLRDLSQTPRFTHRLNEPLPTTEIELLNQSAYVWFGSQLKEQKVWAIAKTFHDLEDDDGFCRHALLCKQ